MMKISYYIAFSQVKSNSDDFGWGVVLNFQKKANQKVNKNYANKSRKNFLWDWRSLMKGGCLQEVIARGKSTVSCN